MTLECKMKTNMSCFDKKIVWTLENFSKLPDLMKSAPFFPMSGNAIKLEIWIKFSYDQHSNYDKSHMLVGIKNLSEGHLSDFPLKVVGNFNFKNSTGAILDDRNKKFEKTIHGKEISNLIKMEFSNKMPAHIRYVYELIDDIFVLECDVTVFSYYTSPVLPVSAISESDVGDVDCEILKLIYEKNAFYDFTIHIGGRKIQAHKLILSARSPVFEKMFEHETLEKTTHSVTLEDVDYYVFNSFIRYVYTFRMEDDVLNDLDTLLELYEVADKYQVEDLQAKCGLLLMTRFLDTDNACKILKVIDMHDDKHLKDTILKFIHSKFSEINSTPEWDRFLKNNVLLAAEILSYVTSKVTVMKEMHKN